MIILSVANHDCRLDQSTTSAKPIHLKKYCSVFENMKVILYYELLNPVIERNSYSRMLPTSHPLSDELEQKRCLLVKEATKFYDNARSHKSNKRCYFLLGIGNSSSR